MKRKKDVDLALLAVNKWNAGGWSEAKALQLLDNVSRGYIVGDATDSYFDFFLLRETKGVELNVGVYEYFLDETKFVGSPSFDAEKLPLVININRESCRLLDRFCKSMPRRGGVKNYGWHAEWF